MKQESISIIKKKKNKSDEIEVPAKSKLSRIEVWYLRL